MNVIVTIVVILLVSAIGGAVHGVMVYGGVILPKTIEKAVEIVKGDGTKGNVQVKMWVPGVIGQAVIGAVSGFLIYAIYSEPTLVLGLKLTVDLILYQVAISIVAGLGGSIAINDLIEKKQWQSLAPVLKNKEPGSLTTTEMLSSGNRPSQVMSLL